MRRTATWTGVTADDDLSTLDWRSLDLVEDDTIWRGTCAHCTWTASRPDREELERLFVLHATQAHGTKHVLFEHYSATAYYEIRPSASEDEAPDDPRDRR